MKKSLLVFALCATIVTIAQPSFEVTILSPSSGASIVGGQSWTFEATIKNTGTNHLGVASGDTLVYAPLFNGNPISGIAWLYTDPIAAGATVTVTQTTGIQGGPAGPIEICAAAVGYGTSYTAGPVTATSTVCNTVNYSPMTIGEMKLSQTFDNSFFSNGTYHVQVSSLVDLKQASIEIVDINGRTVLVQDLSADGGEIRQEISLAGLAKGMYVVKLGTVEGLISINKIMN